jgi:hypothetical protein
MFLMAIRTVLHTEERLATLEMEQGHYLDLTSLLSLIPEPNRGRLWQMIHDNKERFVTAQGSSHNHQAWEGGYIDHVVETMNIACQLYRTFNTVRTLPFELSEALEVMFLHDIEKPFKVGKTLVCLWHDIGTCKDTCLPVEATKDNRKKFRANAIQHYGVLLSWDQDNALRYVEGVPDSEYTPGERTMGELAAFCHMCDIASARLWFDKGRNVPAPNWE